MPGVWRLRLPLPWPGVPHCNAWALAAGDGVVLVDTGMHEPGSMAHLERALEQVGLRVEHVRLVVVHARARRPLRPGGDDRRSAPAARCGCTPPRAPARAPRGPRAALARRLEVAPPERRARGAAAALGRAARASRRPARRLRSWPTASSSPASRSRPTSATWQVIETPGHAPSHVCLHQPDRRLLISGDHLLGRVSLYFDLGYTPDPVGRVPALAGPRRRRSTPGWRWPATAARSPTSPATSPPTASSSPSGWTRCSPRCATAR